MTEWNFLKKRLTQRRPRHRLLPTDYYPHQEERTMRRTAVLVSVTLAIGITLGVLGDRILSAQQQPIKRTELLKTDVAGMEGKEGIVYVAELAPGAVAGKHFHPGPEFGYILEGSLVLEPQGKPAMTLKAGEAFHNPSKAVHDAKNASTTAPAKVLVVLLGEKGQPLATPVQ
jgi:quercetin dioxygenase-like cupin family protein